ncbi:MAG: M20/M25/M40 family metallo-hydrolase [Halodesulfurarchaeum sp.]
MTIDPVRFLSRAVETPSHESVEGMRTLVTDTLQTQGGTSVEVGTDEAGNVIARRGAGRPRLTLNTHLDTVPPPLPFDRNGGRIRGRGACDAKGPLAAMLAAFTEAELENGALELILTPDEETDSAGAASLSLETDGVIVGEPTDLAVCTAARGRFEGTIRLEGTGAHAAGPAAGANAISAAATVLAGLDSFDTEYGPAPHPRLGAPTVTPTLIKGGEAANRVPATATITIDRRSVPPESAETFFDRLRRHLGDLVPDTVDIQVSPADRRTPFLEAFETDETHPLVETFLEAGAGGPRAFGAATEASYFAMDAPTVVFGPGVLADEEGPVAHSDREYVEIPAVRRASEILRATIEGFLAAHVPGNGPS